MLEVIKNIKSENSDLRKLGIITGVILWIIAWFLFWKGNESFQLFLIIGTILFALGIAIPAFLKPIYWVWIIFTTIIGIFMTHMILYLLFYIIFTPIGLFPRLFGKQFLELKWKRSQQSYWNMRTHVIFNKKNYERQI